MNKNKKLKALILPPARPGSLGDEALVVATAEKLHKMGFSTIDIISYNKDPKWSGTNKIKKSIELYDFFFKNTIKSKERFREIIKNYTHYFGLGADVMDGFYGESFSLKRIELLKIANEEKVKSTCLGFSFNSHPKKSTVEALNNLPKEITINARDPVSYRRLKLKLKRPVKQVADCAFLLKPKKVNGIKSWTDKQKKNKRKIIGINANPKVLKELGKDSKELIGIYKKFIEEIYKEGKFSFLLIPHDYRILKGEISDMRLAKLIKASLPKEIKEYCKVLETKCTASQIKYVAGLVDIVLTGRMHLGIAALGQKKPIAGITYQGKFEGLFNFFKLKDNAISPKKALKKDELVKFFKKVLEQEKKMKENISKNLKKVNILSEKNFKL